MASNEFLSWSSRTVLRSGREGPYLSIQDIVVFVRDLEVSLRFYVDVLGFELLADKRTTSDGVGWVEVPVAAQRRSVVGHGLSPAIRFLYRGSLSCAPIIERFTIASLLAS